ncbi:hypothetical protein [Bacillus wiedmannii]|uniref:hypothetical protein n=1 Tax=Bacillus wiedmannii TaxID=1890302 RepID=UPI000BF6BDF8|nr:hypothetical protein [Bacillus wiedmannii]PFZ34337.1 hypothetical protein COL77_30150 [Bacillus wiedmannii]PGA83856.1 hypothetical protein COL94_19475 [Bacillus wiedmannii]PGD66165.1 hypothetical protein COM41_02365 [Bacillus wiedmannii]
MNRKYLAKVGVFALTAGITLLSSIAPGETLSSSASTVNSNEVSDETPFIDVYDKHGNLIKNYTKEEVARLSQSLVPNTLVCSHGNIKKETIVTPLGLNVYNFNGTSFSGSRWINNVVSFTRPQSVHVKAATKTVSFDTYGGLLVFLEI